MKKVVLSVVLLIALLGTSVAYAMETTTYGPFKTKNWSTPVVVSFTTYRQGDITVVAHFNPRSSGGYSLDVSPAGTTNWLCRVASTVSTGLPNTLTCFVPSAPAGSYDAAFRAFLGGSVYVTIDVTAETNP